MAAHILTLPYDVRFLIYQHLFPPGEQIYIHAYGNALQSMSPEYGLPTNALLVCRQINEDMSDYLYSNYLFNIVGTKRDCLVTYKSFLDTLRKHARHEVRVDAFSNGEHSATMCISLQAGEFKNGVLDRRARGEHKPIRELEQEFGMTRHTTWSLERVTIGLAVCGVLLALIAWISASRA
ncbi:hypothetical protein LTR36_002191 [Oleoguttula mirabilis]|uniref:Uncharacterized protein n=1 Tax=Oleoguttula mirabilis TaxID=1507867 RepID=A0AAV9JLY1_9PEZI|nr:hypothetical protein LTR36_002191 [Oleoguttula mirabilis]